MVKNKRTIFVWCGIVTVVVEAITLWLRFGRRIEANEFNRSAPLLLQIHHMFWSLPLFVMAARLRHRPPIAAALVGIGLGLIVSDFWRTTFLCCHSLSATLAGTGRDARSNRSVSTE